MQDAPQNDEISEASGYERHTKPKTSTSLSFHVEAAKPLLLQSFRGTLNKVTTAWNTSNGTQWQDDADICVAAFARGFPPERFQGRAILQNARGQAKLFSSAKKPAAVNGLWELIGKGMPLTTEDALKDGIRQGLFRWDRLPKELKQDVEFALCGPPNKRGSFHQVLRVVADKEKLWVKWACVSPLTLVPAWWAQAPERIVADRELMLSTIAKDANILFYVHPSLAGNLDFVLAALECNSLALSSLPVISLERFPSVLSVERMIKFKAHEHHNAKSLEQNMPASYWSDRGFVLRWLTAGFDLNRALLQRFDEDEEVILTHAKNFPWDWTGHNVYYYQNHESRLWNSDDFIRQLLCLVPAPSVMDSASHKIIDNNGTLMLLAASRKPHYNPSRTSCGCGHRFSSTWGKQLGEYEGFFKGILCGTKAGSGSPLERLNQGSDAFIKKTIADFLDFPKGEQLTWLFQAGVNLEIKGFNPYRLGAGDSPVAT